MIPYIQNTDTPGFERLGLALMSLKSFGLLSEKNLDQVFELLPEEYKEKQFKNSVQGAQAIVRRGFPPLRSPATSDPASAKSSLLFSPTSGSSSVTAPSFTPDLQGGRPPMHPVAGSPPGMGGVGCAVGVMRPDATVPAGHRRSSEGGAHFFQRPQK